MIYIGAENIISPLGITAEENFLEVKSGNTALQVKAGIFRKGEKTIFGQISDYQEISSMTKLESLMIQSLETTISKINKEQLKDKWLLILSTTKGDVDHLKNNDVELAKPSHLLERVKKKLSLKMDTLVVSNACISGLLAVIHANDLLVQGEYDHALVIGADLVTEFTYRGFESFFAISDEPCKPFDANRTGLSLGEAVASVVLSKDSSLFVDKPMSYCGGATANDANHISGPSRNGEGLYRAITNCLKQVDLTKASIDFVSAHGTATKYNDDMESIAFNRIGLGSVPTNSFKGYYGHTLGAASLLELALTMQCMKNSQLIKNMGCDNPGTAEKLNIITENKAQNVRTILKTASGFGGCNGAAIIRMMD